MTLHGVVFPEFPVRDTGGGHHLPNRALVRERTVDRKVYHGSKETTIAAKKKLTGDAPAACRVLVDNVQVFLFFITLKPRVD